MFDKNLVLSILQQIDEALEKIKNRSEQIHSADDFTDSPSIGFYKDVDKSNITDVSVG